MFGSAQLAHDVRVAHQVVRLDTHDGDEHEHHSQGHPPDPIERQRQGHGEETRDDGSGQPAGARETPTCGGQNARKLSDHVRIGVERTHTRQIRRGRTVETVKFVDLIARQRALARHLFQPFPFRFATYPQHINVHWTSVSYMSTQRTQSSAFQDDFVRTGEAVTLDVKPASPPERFAAAVMDATTYFLCTIVLFLMAARFTSPSPSIQRVIVIGFFSTTMLFLPLIVEIATRGRSLGKWAFNLRVVRDDGGAITARHSAVRVSTGILENWATFGGLAVLAEIMSSKGKRLGDLAAGTMVCSQGASVFYPPLVLPPGLEEWARTATILPLDDALVAEARAFLQSNRSLNVGVRGEVALSLAQRLSRRVQTPLPDGLHPEVVIAAVLVARRDREWVRESERRARGKGRFHEATQARFGL